MSARVAFVLALACACGSAPANKPHVAHNGAAPADDGPHRVDLEFALGNKPFPLPIVHGTVAGVATLFLIDTGANANILSGFIARKAELTTRAFGDTGADHTGHAIDTRRAMHPEVHIDNWGDLPDEPILVTDVPDSVVKLGIGGFISPQQLVTADASIVLDFQKSEMRQLKRGETIDAAGSALAIDPPRACIDEDSPLHGLAFVVKAQIESNDAELLIDTGAHHTDLLAQSAPAKALRARSEPSRESSAAISGVVTPRTVHDAHIHVGAIDVTRDVDLIPGVEDDFCPRDGVLAMDVLKKCVLTIDRHTVSGVCASD
jgi:predicted aspartyl protease